MFTVTCDQNADLKRLRRLEIDGKIELHAVAIEELKHTKRISNQNKEKPMGVWGSPHAKWGEAVWGSETSSFKEIQKIIGKENHADVLHLERHVNSGRDYFVTNDNDFLKHRAVLEKTFAIRITTVDELEIELHKSLG